MDNRDFPFFTGLLQVATQIFDVSSARAFDMIIGSVLAYQTLSNFQEFDRGIRSLETFNSYSNARALETSKIGVATCNRPVKSGKSRFSTKVLSRPVQLSR